MSETLDLAKRLVACRSITPDDAGCLDLIGSRLAAAGFACERIDGKVARNLWARHGQGGPLVCLAVLVTVVAWLPAAGAGAIDIKEVTTPLGK